MTGFLNSALRRALKRKHGILMKPIRHTATCSFSSTLSILAKESVLPTSALGTEAGVIWIWKFSWPIKITSSLVACVIPQLTLLAAVEHAHTASSMITPTACFELDDSGHDMTRCASIQSSNRQTKKNGFAVFRGFSPHMKLRCLLAWRVDKLNPLARISVCKRMRKGNTIQKRSA